MHEAIVGKVMKLVQSLVDTGQIAREMQSTVVFEMMQVILDATPAPKTQA